MNSLPTICLVAALCCGITNVAAAQSRTQPSPAPAQKLRVAQTIVDVAPRTLRVGPAAEYPTPSAAAAAARDGDMIEIAPGDYRGDVAVWNASHLRIYGADPRPHLHADGQDAQGKAIWVVRGDDMTIENVEMSGAHVADRNGAAIRAEGRNLILRNVYLHDNENGLLAGAHRSSEITVEHCEFARNGGGDGLTHNLYVGDIAKLTIKQSYLHHAIGGHQVKSRAAISILTDNRLADEADGRASYEADFPNGGQVLLAFNIFQKGPSAENATLVSYGAEGLSSNGKSEFVAKGNTYISQRPSGSRFIFIAPGTATININSNVFAGPAALPDIPGIRTNNAVQQEMPGNLNLKPEGFR